MNRRSVLRWLGLAPVAAPAAVAAASAPSLPPIDYKALSADVCERINHVVEVEANCLVIRDERSGSPPQLIWDPQTQTITIPGLALSQHG